MDGTGIIGTTDEGTGSIIAHSMHFRTPEQHSERMRRVRSVNTKPELAVRRMVWAAGWRYRLHGKALPGKPDLVFASQRKVIFVHGCFWHVHKGCSRATTPKTRIEFWTNKLEGNRRRDASHLLALRKMGWRALVVWECELKNLEGLDGKIRRFLRDKSAGRPKAN